MTPTNLRALVAKAYRVRQGRTFSSSAPNPTADEVGIVGWLLARGVIVSAGYGLATLLTLCRPSRSDKYRKEMDKEAVDFLEKRGKLPPGYLDATYKSGAPPKQNQPL